MRCSTFVFTMQRKNFNEACLPTHCSDEGVIWYTAYSAHHFSVPLRSLFFVVSHGRSWMILTISYATSVNYSLQLRIFAFCIDFDTHYCMFASIYLKNKKLLFLKWHQKPACSILCYSLPVNMEKGNLQTLKIHTKLTTITTTIFLQWCSGVKGNWGLSVRRTHLFSTENAKSSE